MKKYISFLPLAFLIIIFAACKNETEVYPSAKLSDYYPLQSGKYITYKLDSLVYLNFGTRDTTISYEVKYVVDSLITDNLNRPAYRIFRFIRKEDPNPWVPSGTFLAVNTNNTIEFIENNMRFIKLVLPLSNQFSWKGNAFIDTYSLNSDVKYLDDWDYIYDSVGQPLTLGSINIDNGLVVNQRDEIIGNPGDSNAYSEVNIGQEKYGYGIGLVYHKLFHSEYQPSTSGGAGYIADGSYGVTLTMIDHN
jgi:hypothetical protein